MKTISRITAYIAHPLLMPTFVTYLFMRFNPFLFGNVSMDKTLLAIFVITFFLPAVSIFLMKQLDFINSYHMEDKKDRIIPFIAIMTMYFWSYLSIRRGNFPGIMGVFMLGTVISLFVSFFINNFYKLSLHMLGMGGLIATMFLQVLIAPSNINYILLGVIILAGFVGTTRLYLKAHTLSEVYTGFLVGMAGQVFAVMFFR